MIEPQSVQAGESAVSKTTGACPAFSLASRVAAAEFCATIFNPSSSPDPDFSATGPSRATSASGEAATDPDPEAEESAGAASPDED